ncbi:hypothetical protein FGU46_02275 [Methanobacterium sp. CWC-01]|jgi:hypothetical protein|uniref:hypothetical protein n=1 Tax=Methanobacterium aridiramus TaxID=2584467 RepID=UPI00257663E5|nr:hypothetical protein [Methanobacterium sp. CWC-01]WJI08995.1 hypothetical protein FGU46_02275 [Methanobacterium sp. CWC-01]
MKPQKNGKLFIILLIALLAYGFASGVHALGIGEDVGDNLITSDLSLSGDQKISEVSDPSFKPTYLNRRAVNVTNTTTPKNTTTNQTQ